MSNGSKSGFEGSAKNGEKYGYEGSFSEHSHHHHKRPDIAERGMDEEVHGFAAGNLPPLNVSVKSNEPFVPNGSDPSAHDSSFSEHHHKHHKKDIAERGMDEEVHGFTTANLPPLNTRVRSTLPFMSNGSKSGFEGSAKNGEKYGYEGSFSEHSHHHHKRPDIAERGMDEEVHGFASGNLPPLNVSVKSNEPFVPNGSDPSAHDSSFSEHKHKHHHKHHKKDVAERGMDEEVHGFVWHALPPLNTWVRSDDPFVPNGSDPSAHDPDGLSFAQKHHHHHHNAKPDIAERAMDDHFVHPFSADQDVVMPTANPWTRPYLPWNANGGSNVYS
jgi:hypothetical protein